MNMNIHFQVYFAEVYFGLDQHKCIHPLELHQAEHICIHHFHFR